MRHQAKSSQLQVRVSAQQKAAIARAAKQAGMDMSAYVLSRTLPTTSSRFGMLCAACRDPEQARYALAELNSWLAELGPTDLLQAMASGPPADLDAFHSNYIAAMVEYACQREHVAPPVWVHSISPLTMPAFGSELLSLRLHLLTHSPAPFRRRNIFIDSTIGSRV
jgi:hypothetical protein